VAEPVTELGSWRGEQVKVGQVLDALADLRRRSPMGATRTSVVNLVVVARSGDDADRAAAAIAGLGGRHPGRTLMLVPAGSGSGSTGDSGDKVDASVSLLGSEVEGHDVWSEQVTLSVGRAMAHHTDSLIEPFTLPDLPVVVWFVSDLPLADDPVLRSADVVLVDSKVLGDVGAFPRIAELSRRHTVVDLSWGRLRPWRELAAGLFDGRAFAPFVTRVRHVDVTGKEGPRHLLAGWLASRLELPRSAFSLSPARHVSLALAAEGASFEVAREDGKRSVRASASVDGGPSHTDVLTLPDASLPWSLADALTRLERDRVWEQALRGALVFAPAGGP
jgi:glucose-6-phosphate dehydrogenase assembly protein OpcA